MNQTHIQLGHGSGGRLSHELTKDLFLRYFNNRRLQLLGDATLIGKSEEEIAITTDSYVVDPVFFPGGNIGKLAVCGTVNDLAVSGARPAYLSVAFIIEEGFPYSHLGEIVASMASEAEHAGVEIVAGDTKIVNKGKCDKIFINTTGIGFVNQKHEHIVSGKTIQPGDQVIVTGSIGDHGMAILTAREFSQFKSNLTSDCACLNHMIAKILPWEQEVRFIRDATRGGIATVLTEVVENRDFGIEIRENHVPVREEVLGICDLLGYDPLYVANEGKCIIVSSENSAGKILDILRNDPLGKDAAIIGEIVGDHPGRGLLVTSIGGRRVLDMLSGEQLPRIC